MQKYKIIIVVLVAIVTFATVAYLTRLFRKTGVPFYRHNEVYEIIKSSETEFDDSIRNYTQPFKKYGLIEDDDELNHPYIDPLGIVNTDSASN
ncbi:MAG: hypothetical protein M9887_10065 [Chitinophagales bacterium]|nr:hypothetical protein [Chitinophagales bacterium]